MQNMQNTNLAGHLVELVGQQLGRLVKEQENPGKSRTVGNYVKVQMDLALTKTA